MEKTKLNTTKIHIYDNDLIEKDNITKSHRGFTLVELVVVITIIGLLMSVAVPSLASYRVMAQSSVIDTQANQFTKAVTTVVYSNNSSLTPITVSKATLSAIPGMPTRVQGGTFYDVFAVNKLAATMLTSNSFKPASTLAIYNTTPQGTFTISFDPSIVTSSSSAFSAAGTYVTNGDFFDAQGSVYVTYFHTDYNTAPNMDTSLFDLFKDGNKIG